MYIIHINRNVIQYNGKHGTEIPVCRVENESTGEITYCMEARILGPATMIYSPSKPRKCGAKLWIETDSEVKLIGPAKWDDIKHLMEKLG